MSEIKIGILLPQSSQYKNLVQDFIRGVKLNNLPVKYYIEGIGIGNDEKTAIEKMQKMHYQEEVSIIIAFLGHNNITNVYEYAQANGILVIAAGLGATLPYGVPKYDGVYINSYGLVESLYFAAQCVAAQGVEKIYSSTSYYDAGYGMLAAASRGLTENMKQFSGHYITPHLPRENESHFMEETIEHAGNGAVLAFHSGLFAAEHAGFIAENRLLEKYPYYTTYFTLHQDLPPHPENLHVVASWMPGNDACIFSKSYEEAYGSAASVFSLLGFECGLAVKTVLDEAETPYYAQLKKALDKLNVQGPRGALTFDPETNRTYFDHYVFKQDSGSTAFQKKQAFKNNGSFIKEIMAQLQPSSYGGWYNAYLCH